MDKWLHSVCLVIAQRLWALGEVCYGLGDWVLGIGVHEPIEPPWVLQRAIEEAQSPAVLPEESLPAEPPVIETSSPRFDLPLTALSVPRIDTMYEGEDSIAKSWPQPHIWPSILWVIAPPPQAAPLPIEPPVVLLTPEATLAKEFVAETHPRVYEYQRHEVYIKLVKAFPSHPHLYLQRVAEEALV